MQGVRSKHIQSKRNENKITEIKNDSTTSKYKFGKNSLQSFDNYIYSYVHGNHTEESDHRDGQAMSKS